VTTTVDLEVEISVVAEHRITEEVVVGITAGVVVEISVGAVEIMEMTKEEISEVVLISEAAVVVVEDIITEEEEEVDTVPTEEVAANPFMQAHQEEVVDLIMVAAVGVGHLSIHMEVVDLEDSPDLEGELTVLQAEGLVSVGQASHHPEVEAQAVALALALVVSTLNFKQLSVVSF